MTAVILWKEYRQQRAIWLAIAFLTVLLVIIFGATLGHGSGLQVFQEEALRGGLTGVVFILAIAYGVVCGALLLAGESDDGTLTFLDTLTGRREPLWDRKCLAGVILTLTQSFALLALGVGLGFIPWRFALLLPFAALDAFAWGLLGGALCQRVLAGVLIGIAIMACSWFVVPLLEGSAWFVVVKVGAAFTAGYASRLHYSAVDRLRQPKSNRPRKSRFSFVPASVRVLLWLTLRQGQWTLVACVAGTVLLASTVNLAPAMIWPFGTTLLGLACGLSTFIDDQGDGIRFLGGQRLPPGIIWIMKIVFWGAALFALTAVAWYVSVLALLAVHPNFTLFRAADNAYGYEAHWWFEKWMQMGDRTAILDPVIFVVIWPLYGFCIGQYFAQVMRRPILAGILAVFVSPLVAVWIPSFLFGGLSLWQVLVVPVLLLILTRINQRSWLGGRLVTGKPLVVLIAGNIVVALGLAGSIWYRVLEIPDVGEPFDVQAFTASLPTPEQNEAGRLIRRAGLEMHDHRVKVEKELPPPMEVLFPDENAVPGGGGPAAPGGQPVGQGVPGPAPPAPRRIYDYNALLSEIPTRGWPQNDKEIVRWLDRVFEGGWVKDAETAARLPLGMIQDPRYNDGAVDVGNVYQDCHNLVMLFTVRAMQRQAHGDSRAALKDLETALALSRQVKNYAIEPSVMQAYALNGYRRWLQNVPRDKALLRDALAMLQHHEAANPTPDNEIKSLYLSSRHNEPKFTEYSQPDNELLTAAYQVPWEKERQRRLARALIAGQLRASAQPLWENPGWTMPKGNQFDHYTREALLVGLPPADGPGSHISAAKWGELLLQFSVNRPRTPFFITLLVHTARMQTLHAAELATAVALYQADHGTPPDALDALVPDYLAALPNDPYSGESLGYRVSQGEKIELAYPPPITLVPGQAIVFAKRNYVYFPVPHWTK